MTLNGAIMQLVEMRENSMMPDLFKPYFDKVIETISECAEPSEIPHWIPCSEKLLDDDEYAEVLCCDTHKNYIVGYPFADPASETGYSAESDGVYMYDCIAWMKCPEPYKKERGEG